MVSLFFFLSTRGIRGLQRKASFHRCSFILFIFSLSSLYIVIDLIQREDLVVRIFLSSTSPLHYLLRISLNFPCLSSFKCLCQFVTDRSELSLHSLLCCLSSLSHIVMVVISYHHFLLSSLYPLPSTRLAPFFYVVREYPRRKLFSRVRSSNILITKSFLMNRDV